MISIVYHVVIYYLPCDIPLFIMGLVSRTHVVEFLLSCLTHRESTPCTENPKKIIKKISWNLLKMLKRVKRKVPEKDRIGQDLFQFSKVYFCIFAVEKFRNGSIFNWYLYGLISPFWMLLWMVYVCSALLYWLPVLLIWNWLALLVKMTQYLIFSLCYVSWIQKGSIRYYSISLRSVRPICNENKT